MDTVELQEYYPGELGIKRIENNADRVEIFMKTTTQRATYPKCGKITDKKWIYGDFYVYFNLQNTQKYIKNPYKYTDYLTNFFKFIDILEKMCYNIVN